jgi:hypothetical protein
VLQWARANGCPWDERTLALASEKLHLEVVEWAVANGAPVANDSDEDSDEDSDA